jgi:CheY-like chemotaxis protein
VLQTIKHRPALGFPRSFAGQRRRPKARARRAACKKRLLSHIPPLTLPPPAMCSPSLQQTLDALPVMTWCLQDGSDVPFLNSGFRDFLGIEKEAPPTDLWLQSIHPEDRPGRDEAIQSARNIGTLYRVSYRLRRADGSSCWVCESGAPQKNASGAIESWLGAIIPVEAPRNGAHLGDGHNSFPATLASQDGRSSGIGLEERGREAVPSKNPIQERARQQEAVALLGQQALSGAALSDLFTTATDLVRSTLEGLLCSVMQTQDDGSALAVVGISGWPRADAGNLIPTGRSSQSGYTLMVGEPVIVEDMATETRFQISEPVRRIGAVSAITVIIHTEGAPFGVLSAMSMQPRAFTKDDVHFLQSIANVLAAAIDRQRAEERIRLAQEKAEAASRAKSEFLSRMSHELRTPLNAILGFTQLLEIDKPTPSQAESIAHIAKAGQHLLSFINKVLDVARDYAESLSPETNESTLRQVLLGETSSAKRDSGRTLQRIPPSTPDLPRPHPQAPVAPKKILYVEDQEINLRLVERILQNREDYTLLRAPRGEIALEMARNQRPDLILLDLNLPDMTGEAVLCHLKQAPELRSIPVVMLSGMVGDRVESALALGAAGYLTKPYRVPDFFAVLAKNLPA